MQYASTAWYPNLREVHRNTLNTANHSAARTVSGCTRDMNITLVLNEANLLPLDVENEIASASTFQLYARPPSSGNTMPEVPRKLTRKRTEIRRRSRLQRLPS
ncbi:hypothetical protein ElyMa_002289000 [Elysia marginata]|uniref:Uncharacterized protein n=1 Tax=Elysia marginata TaxID=1093978 RepID=A0AAV4G248_9GAST|nr:hypothetical protein ElyMa_002289000 [Elysia marginata]